MQTEESTLEAGSLASSTAMDVSDQLAKILCSVEYGKKAGVSELLRLWAIKDLAELKTNVAHVQRPSFQLRLHVGKNTSNA